MKIHTPTFEQLNFDTYPIHVWHIPLNEVPFRISSDHPLSEMELRRANRIHVPKARNQYMKARSAMRKILGMYLRESPKQIELSYTNYHKPYLECNPRGIEFNISHSSSYALCVVSQNRLVGIDLERMKPLDDLDQLVKSIFTPKELKKYSETPKSKRQAYFYRAWSRKEAFVKAQGKGFFHPVDELDLAGLLPESQTPILLPDINGQNCLWGFKDFIFSNSGEQYQACIFWQGTDEGIQHLELNTN